MRVPISDIEDIFVQRIMNHYGVERSDIKCITDIEYITFEIPALEDEFCNEVLPATVEDNDEVINGCGGTGGGCICLLPKGHGSCHVCAKCEEEWEIKDKQEGEF